MLVDLGTDSGRDGHTDHRRASGQPSTLARSATGPCVSPSSWQRRELGPGTHSGPKMETWAPPAVAVYRGQGQGHGPGPMC